MTKDRINAAIVSLDVDEKRSLFIMLSSDGGINRQGTGSATVFDGDLFMGRTPEPLLQRFLDRVDDELFQHAGVYNMPDPQGKKCKLSLVFYDDAGTTDFEFHYGTESQGPPVEIVDIAKAALRLTDPWFQEQKDRIAKNNS